MYVKHGTLDRVDWGSTIMFLNVSYLNLIFYRTHCCITLRSHRARQYMFLNVSYLKVIWWNSLLNSACRDSIYMFFNKKTVGHLSKLTQWLHPNQLESNQMQWLKLWENIGGKGGGGQVNMLWWTGYIKGAFSHIHPHAKVHQFRGKVACVKTLT